MKRFFLLLIMACSLFISCTKDSLDDVIWNPKELSQTVWEGKILLDGVNIPIVISFDSKTEGYCYLNPPKNQSCLLEYSMTNKEIRFYNIYGDKLIIDGIWHFLISKKNKIKLIGFESNEASNYITLTKISN